MPQPALGEPRGIWWGSCEGTAVPRGWEPWTCRPTRSVRPGLLRFPTKRTRTHGPSSRERAHCTRRPFPRAAPRRPCTRQQSCPPETGGPADVCSRNSPPPEPAEPEAASLSVGVRRARSLVLPGRGPRSTHSTCWTLRSHRPSDPAGLGLAARTRQVPLRSPRDFLARNLRCHLPSEEQPDLPAQP